MELILVPAAAAALAALAYLAHLLVRQPGGGGTHALQAALLASVCAEALGACTVLLPVHAPLLGKLNLAAGVLTTLCWYLFSRFYAREDTAWPPKAVEAVLGAASLAAFAGVLALPPGALLSRPHLGPPTVLLAPAQLLFFFHIGVMLISLVNLEEVLSNAQHGLRWRIKFTVLGAGAVLAAHIVYYSQALYRSHLDPAMLPLKSLGLLAAVSLLFYSTQRGGQGVRFSLSRQAAYNSVILTVVGAYLVAFGLVSMGERYLQDDNAMPVVLGALFLLGLGLVALLLSETLKRKLRDAIQRHFYEDKYDYREQWKKLTDYLAQAETPERLSSLLLHFYCDVFGVNGAALYLRDEDGAGYYRAARLDMSPPETLTPGRELRDDPINLPPVVEHDPAQPVLQADTEQLWTRWSFLVRLESGGTVEGFILLGPPLHAGERFSREDTELMQAVAAQAVAAFRSLRLAGELARARELELLGRLSAFVVHDLKNHVYTLSLVVDNARRYIDNPEFQQDMLESLSGTVARMNLLIGKLRNVPEKDTLHREPADLRDLAAEAIKQLPQGPSLTGDAALVLADREELAKVALNLVLNAQEASPKDRQTGIEVSTGVEDGQAFLRVRDQGCGMDADFIRQKLFKPFKSTKRKGMGIGLFQCRHIVQAHGGRMDVTSAPGQGSTFVVWLPLGQHDQPEDSGNDA